MTWISSQKFHFAYLHLKVKGLKNIHKKGNAVLSVSGENVT